MVYSGEAGVLARQQLALVSGAAFHGSGHPYHSARQTRVQGFGKGDATTLLKRS